MTKIERLRANGFTVIHLAKNVYLVSKSFKRRNGWTIMTIENTKMREKNSSSAIFDREFKI